MRNTVLTVIAMLACAACQPADQPATTAAEPVPPAVARLTPPLKAGAPVNAAVLAATGAGDGALVIGATGNGLSYYASDGSLLGATADVAAGMVVALPDVTLGDSSGPLIVAYDKQASALAAYRLDRRALVLSAAMSAPQPVPDELTGLCHYRSRLSGTDYLYAVTDGGMILHYEVFANDGRAGLQLLRQIPSGKGSGYCAVDDTDGMLYVSEESTGVWGVGAEPESDTTREPVDMREPFGALSDDLKGIAIYPAGPDTSYLLVADVGKENIAVYRLPDAQRLGALHIEGLAEPEGLTAMSGGAGDGLLVIADEDDAGEGPDFKLLDWQTVATAVPLPVLDGTSATAVTAAVVRPVLETDVMPDFGDAADDPAIWVHPDDPMLSLVIGTNKKAGLHVFGLDGRTLQVLPDGRMNNVDLRGSFSLGGETVTLVTASNRSNDSIAAYRIDVARRRLVEVADGVLPTGFADPYGTCMYRDPASNEMYVYVNANGSGVYRQWRLFDNGQGRVAAEQVREFNVGSQAEGCAADDETGHLYVAEEDRGLWRYAAGPDGGDKRVLVDSVGDGHLTDDVEGVSIYVGKDGQGYVIASNQGADNYAVYRRDGDNARVGFFHIIANAAAGIDGASETDGLDVSSVPLGPAYPHGLLVVQDGRNIAPEGPQNFKFVSWADVEAALEVD